MISHYRASTFDADEPKNKSEDLRHFFDRHCYYMAQRIEGVINPRPQGQEFLTCPPQSLVLSMPVKFVCLGGPRAKTCPLPPIMAERIGGYAYYVDDAYCLIGTYEDWLYHISWSQHDWIGNLTLFDCMIYEDMGIILYDNRDPDDLNEEEDCY